MFGMLLDRSAAQPWDTDERQSYTWMAIDATLSYLAGAALYLLFAAKAPAVTEKLSSLFGKQRIERQDLATVLWPTLVLLAVCPIGLHPALARDDDRRCLWPSRKRSRWCACATRARVSPDHRAGHVLFCASINYGVGRTANKKRDLARFRTTRPAKRRARSKSADTEAIRSRRRLLFAQPQRSAQELVLPYCASRSGRAPAVG